MYKNLTTKDEALNRIAYLVCECLHNASEFMEDIIKVEVKDRIEEFGITRDEARNAVKAYVEAHTV